MARAACAGLTIAAWIIFAGNALALGLRIPNQDPEAIARGNAFAATADDPAAIYYNPAGITQLDGENVDVGVHALSVNSTYVTPGGATYHSDYNVLPVPELFYTYSLTNLPLSFGLGVFSPYGTALQWPDDVPFHTSAAYNGQLTYITINPVVAWKITDQLSVAVGPTFNYSQVLLEQGIDPFGDIFKFRGDGTDFGYTGGIRWQPVDAWAFEGQVPQRH